MNGNNIVQWPSLYKVAHGGKLFQAASIFVVVVVGDAEPKRLHKICLFGPLAT